MEKDNFRVERAVVSGLESEIMVCTLVLGRRWCLRGEYRITVKGDVARVG